MPSKHFDIPSILTITVTLVLFVLAVFHNGLTHDLLLEAAVFLVSVKLILMSYKNGVTTKKLDERLDRIEALLTDRQRAA
ncbi:MAG TPA: hypothetical protein VLJ39_18300 [Tepidisphaeraceae bacterium]|nr:hypothetical protein [Tepidisphaeraceae bacterium]